MSLLWTGFGLVLGAALLHGALGLRRPLDRTYLSFACIMASLAAFLVLQSDLYEATTGEAAVEAVRRRVVAALLANASFLVFLPTYTKVRIPPWLMWSYWLVLVFLFIANLFAPYGIWFAMQPEIELALFRNQIYTTVVAPPMAFLQYTYAIFFLSQICLGFGCAFAMLRHGDRVRGWAFAAAVFVVGMHVALDIIRDAVGGAWPYVAEYGFVTWGLIMSVQLALDFRKQADLLSHAIVRVEAQADRLASILGALRTLEQNIDVPIQTLQSGMASLHGGTPRERVQDDRLRRAVGRLRDFSRSMASLTSWPRSSRRAT
jgi:hypothetical protein